LRRVRTFFPMITMCSIGSVFALIAAESQLPTTHAVHSARLVDASKNFTGATFIPSVAPVVSAQVRRADALLSWSSVTTSSGSNVNYRVLRSGLDGTVEVCSGTDAPVVSGSLVSCVDRTVQADASYTYTEQPLLIRQSQTTWSRPTSNVSNALVGPRLYFAEVGPTVTGKGGPLDVPYPSGTQVGDVLVLVSVSGRQNAPNVPAGWSSLVSLGLSGGNAMRLFVAWRIADSGTSVRFDPAANGTGASVRIVRYARERGNAATSVVAAAQAVASSGASSLTFTPTPDLVTNGPNSHAISVVAVRSLSGPVLSADGVFSLENSETSSAGSVGQGVGVAGGQVLSAGTVNSPSWSAATAAAWVAATFAFR
jgi:hypothetical protein